MVAARAGVATAARADTELILEEMSQVGNLTTFVTHYIDRPRISELQVCFSPCYPCPCLQSVHPRTANSSLPSHPDFYGCGSCLARLRIGDAGRCQVELATKIREDSTSIENAP